MAQFSTVGTVVSAGACIEPAAARWLETSRKISSPTLARLPVESGTAYFPDLGREASAVLFAYGNGAKARAFPDKSFVTTKGFKASFWNLEQVLRSGARRVFITEGELDACSLVESGIAANEVISVPNGAKERPADDPKEQRGYGYVLDALKAGLNRVQKIVWCGDGDAAGVSLRSDMVKLFGAARVWFVTWPEGTKDANDVLKSDGGNCLRELVTDGALPWPVDGLYRLDELPEPKALTIWRPGFPEWESKVMLAPRTVSVVTGQAGHGKTVLWSQIWFQVVKEYGVPACIAAFETRAKPHIRRYLRTFLCGKLERDMTSEEISKADEWINDHYLFAVHPESRPTLDWLLDMAEVAVVRHGVRIFQLDPWNRLESSRNRDETETEYIGRCLRTMHLFAQDMNCHVQVVAHPAKSDTSTRGKAPELDQISGSKNWENMVDQGFSIYRQQMFDGAERKTEATLYHRKARYDELGYPCKLALRYELPRGRFVSTDYEGV